MQQLIEQARAAHRKADALSRKLTEAFCVIADHDKSLDKLLCKDGMQNLLGAAPELDALALKRSPVTAEKFPETAKSITDAVNAYMNGDIKAVRVVKEYARNDNNGNDRYKASFSFLSEYGQVDAVITVVEDRDVSGYNLELSDGEGERWFHFKGQPVSPAERLALKEMLEQAAIDVVGDDINFVNAPDANDLNAAKQLIERLAPVLADIEI